METNKKQGERLRPTELILQYLEADAFSGNLQSEARLPTIRELAERLRVGVSTVGAVYRDLAQQGRIRTEVGNGSFLIPSSAKVQSTELRIGVGLSNRVLRDPEKWHSRIYGGITAATLHSGRPAVLVPLDVTGPEDGFARQIEGLNALIIMPGHLLKPSLIAAAERAGIPTVYVNPPRDGETKNFVAADFAGAATALGEAFRLAGRKDILLLLEDPCHLSISAHFRLVGLLTGLRYGEDCALKFRLEVANGTSIEDGRSALRRILEESGRCPDAIYASGDFLAIGCVEELEARGFSVPQQVSVVGGTGLNLKQYSHPRLTCCSQSFEEIGVEIIEMVLQSLDSRGKALPGRLVPMGWNGGTTTLAAENKVLEAYTARISASRNR